MKNSRNLKRLGAAVAVVSSAFVLEPSFVAADSTYHPGSLCQFAGNVENADNLFPAGNGGESLTNVGTTNISIKCAQIRDDAGAANIGYAQILASEGVTCSLWRRNAYDLTETFYSQSGTDFLSGPWVRHAWFSGSAVGTGSGGDMWGFFCVLPPNASILSYEFNEG